MKRYEISQNVAKRNKMSNTAKYGVNISKISTNRCRFTKKPIQNSSAILDTIDRLPCWCGTVTLQVRILHGYIYNTIGMSLPICLLYSDRPPPSWPTEYWLYQNITSLNVSSNVLLCEKYILISLRRAIEF